MTVADAVKITSQQASDSKQQEIYYPDGDGKPMAESDLHLEVTIYCRESLQAFFAERDDVYVAANNFLYYMRGRPRAVISPDCYVVFGVASHLRDSYKVWEENDRFPAVVFEITSSSTRDVDIERKFELYQDVLGVPEYILFDPTRDYIDSRLTGYRLTPQGYVDIEADDEGRLYSEQLGLYMFSEGNRLRFYDPARGEVFPTNREARERALQEAQRAELEAQRANMEAQARAEAEARLAQSQAELEALRKQMQEAASLRQASEASNTNND